MRDGPDFLIIGAAKSGTTSLFRHLGQHEDVMLPDMKEPGYFAYGTGQNPSPDFKDTVEDFGCYESLFEKTGEEAITGEASPAYMYFPHVPKEIKSKFPKVKLIAILRDPVDRAHSHYHNARRALTEPAETFREAVEAELRVLDEEWKVGKHPRPYLRFSLYGQQLQRYYNQFSPSQIKVISFKRFVENTSQVLGEVTSFLGTRDFARKPIRKGRNPGFSFRSYEMYKLFQPETAFSKAVRRCFGTSAYSILRGVVAKLNRTDVPEVDSELRNRLRRVFSEDVRRLQSLTGKEFDWWDLR